MQNCKQTFRLIHRYIFAYHSFTLSPSAAFGTMKTPLCFTQTTFFSANSPSSTLNLQLICMLCSLCVPTSRSLSNLSPSFMVLQIDMSTFSGGPKITKHWSAMQVRSYLSYSMGLRLFRRCLVHLTDQDLNITKLTGKMITRWQKLFKIQINGQDIAFWGFISNLLWFKIEKEVKQILYAYCSQFTNRR